MSAVLIEHAGADALPQESNTLLRRRFIDEVNPHVKAEFINGETIVHSPASRLHIRTLGRLLNLLENFVEDHALGEIHFEKALCLFPENAYEPDLCFFGHAKLLTLAEDAKVFPIPDLVVEILSPSTRYRDRGVKLDDYGVSGVGEYWLIDAKECVVDQYLPLPGERTYGPPKILRPAEILVSQVASGFSVPVAALFEPGAYRAARSAR